MKNTSVSNTSGKLKIFLKYSCQYLAVWKDADPKACFSCKCYKNSQPKKK